VKVYFKTYGCTLNQADTEIMESLVETVKDENQADVIVVNTCGVKGPTESKIINYLDNLKASGKKFVIAGCLTANENLVKKYGVPIVKTSSINKIKQAVMDALNGKQTIYKDLDNRGNIPRFKPPIAKIPIQQGCLSACHFCFTKLARKYQSLSIGEVERWVNAALYDGCIELEFTGTDLGSYGKDIRSNLAELLNVIIKKEYVFKIRLGMSSPHYFKNMIEDLLTIYESDKLYKFAHLSVQSGSEKLVKEMNRSHTVEDWIYVNNRFREKFGREFSIVTDIIVGYPTETEYDFEQTLSFLEKYKPDVVNLSKFTPRPYTYAAKLRQLPSEVIKNRSLIASKIIKEIAYKNNQFFVGKTYRVLVTEKMKGRNDAYKQVILDKDVKIGSFVDVEIYEANHTSLFGKVI